MYLNKTTFNEVLPSELTIKVFFISENAEVAKFLSISKPFWKHFEMVKDIFYFLSDGY